MAIGLDEKKAIVAEVNETAASALSLVVADARGVASNDMTALRATARESQVDLRVVRNTLAKRAFEGTEYECVSDTLTGPSLFGFSLEDPGAAARLFKDFAKTNERFEVKALSISGKLMGNTIFLFLSTQGAEWRVQMIPYAFIHAIYVFGYKCCSPSQI